MAAHSKVRIGTRHISSASLIDPMAILSAESRMLIKGVAGRMHAEHYGSTTQRIVVLCDSLAGFGKERISKMTPQDVWENLKSYVHEDGNKHHCRFDSYPRSDDRHDKYPPAGICPCGAIQIARVKQRGARVSGQYLVTISNNQVLSVVFNCSSCIAREIHKARANNKMPPRYHSYEKALRLASTPKKTKGNRRIARKSRVIARKLTRHARNLFKR